MWSKFNQNRPISVQIKGCDRQTDRQTDIRSPQVPRSKDLGTENKHMKQNKIKYDDIDLGLLFHLILSFFRRMLNHLTQIFPLEDISRLPMVLMIKASCLSLFPIPMRSKKFQSCQQRTSLTPLSSFVLSLILFLHHKLQRQPLKV